MRNNNERLASDPGARACAALPAREAVATRAMASADAWIAIDGMVCGSCTSAVTSALEGTAGVRAVSVSLESKSASVTYDPGSVDADALRDVVEACGFDVTAVDPEAVAEDAEKPYTLGSRRCSPNPERRSPTFLLENRVPARSARKRLLSAKSASYPNAW